MKYIVFLSCLVLLVRTKLAESTTASSSEQRLDVERTLQQTGKEIVGELWQRLAAFETSEEESQAYARWQWLLHDVLMLFVGFLSCKFILILGQSAINHTPTRKKVFFEEVEHEHADVWGCTALHRAAQDNSYHEVGELLKQGFDPNARDAWDETPLHMAARSGEIEAARVLLSFGARIDAVNFDDKTPLVIAAEANQSIVCEFLLDRGATAGGLDDQKLPALLGLLALQRMTVSHACESPPAWNQFGKAGNWQLMSKQMRIVSEGTASGLSGKEDSLDALPRSFNRSTDGDRHIQGKAENWHHLGVRMEKVFEALLAECSESEENCDSAPDRQCLAAQEADNMLGRAENWRHQGERMQKVFSDSASEVSEVDYDLGPMRNDLTPSSGLPSLLGSQKQCKQKLRSL